MDCGTSPEPRSAQAGRGKAKPPRDHPAHSRAGGTSAHPQQCHELLQVPQPPVGGRHS